jgi:hypothetical protein
MQRRTWLALVPAALLPAACARLSTIQSGGGPFIGHASMAQRSEQIQRGAASRGWVTELRGPGLIRAILNLRTHQAVVDITYDAQRFSIQYVSSANLNENAGYIHSNYNSWVQNLQQSIMAQDIPPPSPMMAPGPAHSRGHRGR